ncbi:ATP-binding protein, partial [bacterium]|nr:ATP-binding protein [bacterium]
MIKGYKLVYSPTSDKRFRYKVKIRADESSCLSVIKEIGPICGRPFKNIGSDFQKAFYVYGSSDEIKAQIIFALEKHASAADSVSLLPQPALDDTDDRGPLIFTESAPGASAEEVLKPSLLEEEKSAELCAAPSAAPLDEALNPTTQEVHSGNVSSAEDESASGRAEFAVAESPPWRTDGERLDALKDEWNKFDIPPLNSKYTFDNLYEGGFNRFLKQACEDIAKEFAPSYNPLFIWGGVGRGKTHLIQALGNFIKKYQDDKTVFYIQAQDLITMIQDALSSPAKKALLLKKFGSADALLIDDIQFLEGDKIQDTFFLIFERAYQKNHQIVITSDRSPKRLAGFTDRLRSRFEWGLVNKLQKPDFTSRREILKMKISTDFTSLNLTEDMLDYIADKFKDNIRELEGVLKKLNIYCKLQGEEITMETLQNIVSELLGEEIVDEEERAEKLSMPPPVSVNPVEKPASAPSAIPAAVGVFPEPREENTSLSETAILPPPTDFPPPPPEAQCPNCGAELSHIEMYDRWYCYGCQRYAPPEFGKGKFGLSSGSRKKDQKVDLEKLAALEELRKLASPKNTEPISIIEEKDLKPASAPHGGAKSAPAEKKEEAPSPSTPIKFTREIQCALFYPVRSDSAIKLVTDFVQTTVAKHRLHIKFEFIVVQEYDTPHINYSSFLNVLNTAKIKVAIVVGPAKSSGVNEDEFYEKLNGMFTDEGFCFEYIAFKD